MAVTRAGLENGLLSDFMINSQGGRLFKTSFSRRLGEREKVVYLILLITFDVTSRPDQYSRSFKRNKSTPSVLQKTFSFQKNIVM